MKEIKALFVAAALAVVATVAAAPAQAAPSTAQAPCGLHYEAGIPVELWWNNCSLNAQIVLIHWLVTPNQEACVPAGRDMRLASQNYDNPVNFATDITFVREDPRQCR